MWSYICPECDSYWESFQSTPDREWCSCGTSDVPERWDIPEEFWPSETHS